MPCEPIKGEGLTGIMCGGRSRNKPCHYCGRRLGLLLCDHPVIRKGKRTTCDTLMCADCTNLVQENVDLCRAHFNLYRNNGNAFKLGGVEIQS